MRGDKLLRFYSLAFAFTIDASKLMQMLISICNQFILKPRIIPPLRGSYIFFIFFPGVPPLFGAPRPGYYTPPQRGSELGSLRSRGFARGVFLDEQQFVEGRVTTFNGKLKNRRLSLHDASGK